MFYNKLFQSISASFTSFIISLPNVKKVVQNSNEVLENLLLIGQMLSVWVLLIIGVVKFYHYLRDYKKKKEPK